MSCCVKVVALCEQHDMCSARRETSLVHNLDPMPGEPKELKMSLNPGR